MFYNLNYKLFLLNFFNNFNKNFLLYISGKYNENEFKTFRLYYGIYRQKNSYMLRVGIPFCVINYFQFITLSYISLLYDNKYFHLTTRSNVQFNWLKVFDFFNIFICFTFVFLSTIQTSGNCVRNIISSCSRNYFYLSWFEIIRQWFNMNFEFLFLPRKFKISFLDTKKDNISSKVNDISYYFKKTNKNNITFSISVGGGLGRTPIIGVYILKHIHWKNILNFSDKILRIYNSYGYRNNIYKSRLKILIKSLNNLNFISFIYNEFNFLNKFLYVNTEKELNFFLKKSFLNFESDIFVKKQISNNFFFLNWFKFNFFQFLIYLPLKNNNKPSGDINFLQIKIIFFYFSRFLKFRLYNRQNIIFLYITIGLDLIYLKLKKYFFNVFNFDFLTDIISCPGYDYCNLANAKSISILNLIQSIFIDYNTIHKLGNIYLNISGCINSCSHHHVSNIGILGVNKNNNFYYQIYTGGNFNSYESLIFSKFLFSSFIYYKLYYFLIKIIKIFLIKNNNIDFSSFFYFYNFKNFI